MDSDDKQGDDPDDTMVMAITMTRNQFAKSLQLTNFFRKIVPPAQTQSFFYARQRSMDWHYVRQRMYYVRNTMYVVGLDGVGLDYSPTRLCLGLCFLSMVEMMMMRRRMKIIKKSVGLDISLLVGTKIDMNL